MTTRALMRTMIRATTRPLARDRVVPKIAAVSRPSNDIERNTPATSRSPSRRPRSSRDRARACVLVWCARTAVAGGLGLGGAACAPSLATLQPAHVAPKGHLMVVAGTSVALPSGGVQSVIDVGRTVATAASTQQITDAQKGQLVDAAIRVASAAPSVAPHFALALTVIDRLEVNLESAGGAWRLGGRYQLLTRDEGPCDLTVGLGVSRSSRGLPFADFLPVVRSSEVTRWSLDVPILLGTQRRWFRAWVGPRLLYAHLDASLGVDLFQAEPLSAQFVVNGSYLGGQGGFAIGYRPIFLAFELTGAQLSASANVTTNFAAPRNDVKVSGVIWTPAVALLGEF